MATEWNKADKIIAGIGAGAVVVFGVWNAYIARSNNELQKTVATAEADRAAMQETQTAIMLHSDLPFLSTTATGEIKEIRAGVINIARRRFLATIITADLGFVIENSGGQDDSLKEISPVSIFIEALFMSLEEAVTVPIESLLGPGAKIIPGWGLNRGDYARHWIDIPAGEETEVFTSYTLCQMYEIADDPPAYLYITQIERPSTVEEVPGYLEEHGALIVRPRLDFLRSEPPAIEIQLSFENARDLMGGLSTRTFQQVCP